MKSTMKSSLGVSSSLSMDNQHLGTMLSGTARRNSISNMELRTSESFDSESSSLKGKIHPS